MLKTYLQKQKSPVNRRGFKRHEEGLGRNNTNVFATLWTFNFKLHHTVCLSKQSMVGATTYVFTSVKASAALTNNNAARANSLTTKTFYTKTLTLRVASVTSNTTSLHVSHESLLIP